MLKEYIISVLQFLLGYERYLTIFSFIKITTLSLDRRKSDYLFFHRQLSDHATIIVIGACTGITTVPLANKKNSRRLFAYEPLHSNFKVLNTMVQSYRLTNVSTYNLGLGNRQERKEMLLPIIGGAKKQGMAYLKDASTHVQFKGNSEEVELDALDNRSEIHSFKIDAIKLVAENYEYQILEGAKTVIQKNQPIIYCELYENENRTKVLDLMRNLNYTIHYRKGDKLISFQPNHYSGRNFFFLPANA